MDLMKLIHGSDVYEGFSECYEYDLQGWSDPRFFKKMVEIVKPKLAIEVGTWKGKSAVATASAMRNSGVEDPKLLCIDTWLGATEFIGLGEDPKRGLKPLHGWPQVYNVFMSNVMYTNLHDTIIPFPQTSANAAKFLKKNFVKADMIFIDGSHEYNDVSDDIFSYIGLLNSGGVLCGDDYCEYWSGVKRAVNEATSVYGMKLNTISYTVEGSLVPCDYWVLSKNGVTL